MLSVSPAVPFQPWSKLQTRSIPDDTDDDALPASSPIITRAATRSILSMLKVVPLRGREGVSKKRLG